LRFFNGLFLATLVVFALEIQVPASAQQVIAPPVTAEVSWNSLSADQKIALAPLSSTWSTLSDGHRRKWMAIAQSYPKLSDADKEKMRSRMVEWAALTPKDREQARLNFAKTKSVEQSERASNWEAYQALSPEEKQKLASSAAEKPLGAAVTAKPVAPEKLAKVPVTRHTPEDKKAEAGSKTPLDKNTLLPQRTAATSDNSGASGAEKP
jgi:hypothetical protein